MFVYQKILNNTLPPFHKNLHSVFHFWRIHSLSLECSDSDSYQHFLSSISWFWTTTNGKVKLEWIHCLTVGKTWQHEFCSHRNAARNREIWILEIIKYACLFPMQHSKRYFTLLHSVLSSLLQELYENCVAALYSLRAQTLLRYMDTLQ